MVKIINIMNLTKILLNILLSKIIYDLCTIEKTDPVDKYEKVDPNKVIHVPCK